MFITGEQVYLRAIEPGDLDFLYRLENDTSIWLVSNTTTPYAKHVLQNYIDQAAVDIYTAKQLRLLICTPQHQAVGAIDLFDFDPTHQRAGIGIVIVPPYQQQGYATEALHLLLHYCREQLLLHQVYCSVISTNHKSLQLFKKANFQHVGIRHQWIRTTEGWQDQVEFQKILTD